jgi:hypothetical protein
MNFDEMVAQVLPIFPNAIFGEVDGEIVISTATQLINDEVIPMEEI